MIRSLGTLLVRGAAAFLVLGAVVSCSAGSPAAPPTPGASAPSATAASPATPAPPATPTQTAGDEATASCDRGQWQSAPLTVTRPVPTSSVSVVTAVRTAAHPECGYDRLALDLTGAMPSYTIRQVTHVTADPSGKPVTLPGHSYLLITLRPAQGHAASGTPTIVRFPQSLGYPVLRSYALVGDFEGALTLAIGLDHTPSIRVGELPGRWYIDVRT
ncbi:MAG: AMIN-like domain-containing (lipo)protein [Streptosporangiaceae bacterium]